VANEIVSSKPFIDGRGESFCRGCLGENLFSALDLGDLPIANELLLKSGGKVEKFPLHLKICIDCGLGQVSDVVTPERIFRDYRYLSSLSTTFLKHALDFVNQQIQGETFSPEDWVLEIASNDGYLLKNFIPHGIKVVGVEPAENVSQLSRELGIETISEFFSNQLAIELLSKYGFPKLIIANNVMAHVPDLIDFIKGLAVLCGPDTKISIENPSLANILLGMQFDTIYHEHYSYLSASSVFKLSKMYGLHLFKVDQLMIHGGSNRYWLNKSKVENFIDPSVVTALKLEQDKASTILNSIDATPKLVAGIADLSPEKQGRIMPINGIKIISPEELFRKNPTDIVIFPWNIKLEIASYLRLHLGDEVRLWCLVPELHRVEI